VAYAGGAWLLLQLLALVAQPFAWPDLVMKAAIIIVGVGFVAVLVLAWFHGEKGQQKASGVELLMLGALCIVAAVAVMIVSRNGRDSRDVATQAASDTSSLPSIAVLPFDNIGDDPENEYFADGITEDLLNNLSRINGLIVKGRTSMAQYRGTDKSASVIARELRVTHLLRGSVRRGDTMVVINAQLIRADNDELLWSQRYDHALTDIFALQSQIATTIAGALDAELTSSDARRLARRPTDNLEAYDKYLQARREFARFTTGSMGKAVELLHEAIAMDTQFVNAIALLGRTFAQGGIFNPAESDSALHYSQRAVRLDEGNADAHSAMGETMRQQGRYEEALTHYRRALEIEPNHAWSVAETGETLGSFGLGRMDEAVPWLERAVALEPATGWMLNSLADNYRQLGALDEADKLLERAMRLDPAFVSAAATRAMLAYQRDDTVASMQYLQRLRIRADGGYSSGVVDRWIMAGNRPKATEHAREVPDSLIKRFRSAIPEMYLYYARGDAKRTRDAAARAEAEIERHLERGNRAAYGQLMLAITALVRDDRNAALNAIEEYYRLGGRDEMMLRRHLMLEPLQNEPRMRAVQEQIRRDVAQQWNRLQQSRGG
jgi:TolB-like protein/lipopolysaccharide biosynthesis regulator YciM